MKTKILIALSVLLLCAVFVGAEEAPQRPSGDEVVEVDGFGVTQSDALLKAKREAVAKGIGTVLISETEVKNFTLQKDVILTKTVGAVKSYEILKQEQQKDGYFVLIRAVVSLASLREDLMALKILLESMDKPRMMVLITEEHGNSAETKVVDYLTSKEFELVDPSVVAALMQKEEALIRKATTGDPVAAAQLGAENGAEYVLVGNVSKSVSKNDMLAASGMVSGQANINAKVINASTAKIIASKSASAAAAHISDETAKAKAAEKAAEKLMDNALFEKIVGSFQDMVNNGIAYDVTIKNVKDFAAQKVITALFTELEAVSVNKRGFSGGVLKLSVVFKGSADTFGGAVDGKAVGDKKLQVTDIVGNRIGMKIE